jgi:hypothetical protein
MKQLSVSLVLVLAGAGCIQALPAAEPHRQHGAHVHGEATLNIGLDGQLLLISLEAPGVSLLGFEHTPRDDPERSLYRHTLELLGMPEQWLTLPASAACSLESTDVQPHGFEPGAERASANADRESPGAHSDEAHHEHADFDATYRYSCHAPLALRTLDVRLFDAFPDLHKINVNLVLPDRQGSQVLLPGTTTLPLSQ